MKLDPAALLLLQLAVVVAAGRALSRLGRFARQPTVVCEMIAGILLGPSLFGRLAPAASAALFPRASLPLLAAVGQIGLSLYMFAMGLEFRRDLLASGWRASAAVSLSGVAAPLAAGAWLGALLHARGLFAPGAERWQAMLFVGAALSVTAFPVLARIVSELGLSGTPLGTLAIGAGAFDDAAAWSLLAVLLASLDGNARGAVLALGGGAAIAALLVLAVRPAAAALTERAGPGALGAAALGWALAALLLSSWATDAVGLHAEFGAFLFGAVLPRGAFAARLRERVEPLTTAILIPAFFAYSGLNTRLDLFGAAGLWGTAALVLLVATATKGGACALAARAAGRDWVESAAIGALMNARGLMELILLNIALQRGVIGAELFTILALTAVATTFAATPAFEALRPRLSPDAAGRRGAAPAGARPRD